MDIINDTSEPNDADAYNYRAECHKYNGDNLSAKADRQKTRKLTRKKS